MVDEMDRRQPGALGGTERRRRHATRSEYPTILALADTTRARARGHGVGANWAGRETPRRIRTNDTQRARARRDAEEEVCPNQTS